MLESKHINAFKKTGAEILTSAGDCWVYGADNSRMHALPDAVALVTSHEQTLAIVRICNEYLIPITARGRGTGTTGAAVPIHGGILISFERMDKILSIDSVNRTICVQSGISNQQLQNYCHKYGFFWPPDPGSATVCTVGGNLACNASGPHAVKYGTTRENTLGIKAITANGIEIITGVQTSKGVVGLDLTRLLIGSEGTLALITEAVLKLTPIPLTTKTMCAYFNTTTDAGEVVAKIMTQNFIPSALEFMDSTSLHLLREYSNVNINTRAHAMLLIEVDGDETTTLSATKTIKALVHQHDLLEFNIAENEKHALALHAARKALSPTLRKISSGKINEDIVIPLSKFTLFIAKTQTLAQKYNLTIANFGHAGNGNLHVNILYDKEQDIQTQAAKNCLSEIFDVTLEMGGTLSGEHGIGLTKREYVSREIPDNTLALMRSIVDLFDPNKILNRCKSLPD